MSLGQASQKNQYFPIKVSIKGKSAAPEFITEFAFSGFQLSVLSSHARLYVCGIGTSTFLQLLIKRDNWLPAHKLTRNNFFFFFCLNLKDAYTYSPGRDNASWNASLHPMSVLNHLSIEKVATTGTFVALSVGHPPVIQID